MAVAVSATEIPAITVVWLALVASAKSEKAFIIPILLDDTPISDFPAFENMYCINISKGDFKENMKQFLQAIKASK